MMTRRRRGAAVGLALALLLACGAGPAAAGRTTSASFLKIGVGGRAAAMGEAYTAMDGDITSLYWNPAGLAGLERQGFVAMHNEWFQGIKYEYLGYARPLARGGVLGGSLTYLDKGEQARTTYGNPYGTGMGTFGASDYAGAATYALRYSDNFDLGGTFKFVRQELDNATANAWALDGGLLYHGLYPGLTLGAAFQNLGTSPKFDSVKEELPLLLKTGAAYRLPSWPVTVSADGVFLAGDASSFRMGVEYSFNKFLDFRAGYNSANDAGNGWGGGFGVNIDDLHLNYAFVPFGDLGNTHRIDSIFYFGESVAKPVAPVSAPGPAPRSPTGPVIGARPPIRGTPSPEPTPAPTPTPTPAPLPTPEPAVVIRVEGLLQQAAVLTAAGKYREAVPIYQQVLALDPVNYEAYYNLGCAAFQLKEHTAARDAFTYALRLKPQSVEAMVNLGSAQYKLEDYPAAAESWLKALRLQPTNTQAKHNLDYLYQTHPELKPAAMAPAATPSPGNDTGTPRPEPAAQPVSPPTPVAPSYEASYNQGCAAFQARDYYSARIAFTDALRLWPSSIDAKVNLGSTYYKLGYYPLAATWWQEAMQFQPENTQVKRNLEILYRDHPELQPEAAVPAETGTVPVSTPPAAVPFTPAPTATPPPPAPTSAGQVQSLLRQAAELVAAGKHREAVPLYQQVLALDRVNYDAYYNLGCAAFQLQDYPAARDAFTYALRLKPQSLDAMVNLGAAFYKLGDYPSAAKHWQEAFRLQPENQQTRRNLDTLYRDHPELQPAAAVSVVPAAPAPTPSAAVTPEPAPAPIPVPLTETTHPLLREAYQAQMRGETQRAAELYWEYLQGAPADTVANYNLGNILYGMRDYDGAVTCYQTVLRVEGEHERALTNLGAAYYKLKRFPLAEQLWLRVLRANPANDAAQRNLDTVRRVMAAQKP